MNKLKHITLFYSIVHVCFVLYIYSMEQNQQVAQTSCVVQTAAN